MPATSTYYPSAPALPRALPSKPLAGSSPNAGTLHPSPWRSAGSPPGAPSYASSIASSAVPSLTQGGSASAASPAIGAAPSVDLLDLMTERISHAVDPVAMDRSLATQAQASGALNAKQRELAELQALAQRRLRGTKANLADGYRAAKEVTTDLRWTQKRVSQMNALAASKYPQAYATASKRYPSPEV